MQQIKTLIFLLIPFISGCSYINTTNIEQPEGEFFISLLVTEHAFSGVNKKKEGFVFYIEQPSYLDVSSFLLNGYRYKKGKIVESFSHGSITGSDYIKRIHEVNLKPFDYDKELEKAVIEAEKEHDLVILHGRDGSESELRIKTVDGEFVIRKWHLSDQIEFLSPYNENIRKLHIILEILANYYGTYHLYL